MLIKRALGALACATLIACGGSDDEGEASACIKASNFSEADLQAAYQAWKDDLLVSEGAGGHLRVRRPDTPDGLPNSTVSEGIAYGMLIAVYMNDQQTFDELWKYEQQWLDPNTGLMYWYIDPEGTTVCPGRDEACGPATDSDEDMAFALIMADRKWGGQGTLDEPYLTYAKRQIDAILQHEIGPAPSYVVQPGAWGGVEHFNISYFAPAFYRLFAEVSGNDKWLTVVDQSYKYMNVSLNEKNGNQQNGLVPGWSDSFGNPVDPEDGHFQYDAIRTPFRIGQDWCWNREPRAKEYLDKVSSFFVGVGVDNLVDGYNLDGTPHPDANSAEPSKSAVFVGCSAVGAMSNSEYQSYVDRAYERLTGLDLNTRSRYYQRSWTVLSMLMMGGKFTLNP